MNFIDKVSEGIIVLIIGLMIVFAVLILLWGMLSLFKIIFNKEDKTKSAKTEIINNDNKPGNEVVIKKEINEDDTQIVAVITAAIAAVLGKNTSSFKIRSIKRVSNWKK